MGSYIGKNIRVSVFGQSHSSAIGCVVEGFPVGLAVDQEALSAFLKRRAPGDLPWSTPRKEADEPEFLGGLVDDVTCGAPLAAIIRNTNTRSADYDALRRVPRPGHADYVAEVKFGGAQDSSGGGHFSGRLTAPLCIAGGIAKQFLERCGVYVGAHLRRVAGIEDAAWDMCNLVPKDIVAPGSKRFPVVDDEAGERMVNAIVDARSSRDSVGGVVECAAVGMPIGVGEPMFDGIENAIASYCFGIPAVKGVEFGRGFEAADMRGSEHNDPYYMDGDEIAFRSNNAGGILGGISTGEPIVFRVAFKPTSSIFIEQNSVDIKERADAKLLLKGRHDPCVAVRAVPVVEAVCALALYDLLLEERMDR